MAMSLLMRNSIKCNGLGAGLLRTVRLSPLKTYTTASVPKQLLMPKPATIPKQLLLPKPLALSNALVPASRQISLTAPKMSSSGNFTLIWSAERALSLVLLFVVPIAFFFPSQTTDAIFAATVVLHTHWGLEAMITDYVRESIFGKVVPRVAHLVLFVTSIATLGGLFYFIYNDIGIVKSLQKFWAIKGGKNN